MRRLLIWIGLFGLTVWVALRILRVLDRIPATDDAPPRTDTTPRYTNSASADAPPPTDSASVDAIPPPADSGSADAIPPTDDPPLEAYCARCRTRRILTNVREETTATGRRAGRGACAVCGTTVFTFLPAKQST
jgi:hypothetical protein